MGFNAKLFEVIVYPESYNVQGLQSVLDCLGRVRHWAYICHDKDENKEHYHIAIRTKDTCNSDNVAKWFEVSENAVAKVKGRWSDMLLYLTHRNAPEKYQYPDEAVVSNFDWKKAIQSADGYDLDELLRCIDRGECRQYNQDEYVDVVNYAKYKQRIKAAYEYRQQKLMSLKGVGDYMANVVWVCGEAGSGKTTLAKFLCDSKGLKYFMSSSGSDPLGEYACEPAIILDDVRPEEFSPPVLLKLLDPHNQTATKSRYNNKWIEAEFIVVTCPFSPEVWWGNYRKSHPDSGSWEQLTRRINQGCYHLSADGMRCTIYDPQGKVQHTVEIDIPEALRDRVARRDSAVVDPNAFVKQVLGEGFSVKVKGEGKQLNMFYQLTDDDDKLPF